MHPQTGRILPLYAFHPLRDIHLPFLTTWIKMMAPAGATGWLTLLQLFQEQPQYWNSSQTRSWMMEVNGQPAFCISFDSYHKAEALENNRLSLLSAPSIQRAPAKLMRAWQASAMYIFQQQKPAWLTVELHISEIEAREALQRIGFRETGEEDPGSIFRYICKSGELNPVF
ncbi:MAG TPA: hypothetical protein VNS58_27230 [Puia sp.]|nr:hypothetical protein [Puia sp.]